MNDTYEFTLILEGYEIDDQMAERVYEAGCADASLSSSCGVIMLEFNRKEESKDAAIASAVSDVQASGYAVVRIDRCD